MKNKKISILIIAVSAILVIAFVAIYNQNNDIKKLENNIKAELGQLENKKNEEIQAALDEVIEEGSLRISINANPVFYDGISNGTLMIENHPNNLYNLNCIIFSDIDEDGKTEEIYNSGLMPINSHIQEDCLSETLEQGEYDAVAVFTALDTETNDIVGKAEAKIKITILN